MTADREREGLSVGFGDESSPDDGSGEDGFADRPSQICDIVLDTLEGEGVQFGHIDVTLIDAEEMAALNVEHMGHVGPTDVLSFPMDADEPDVDPGDGPVRHLGDIVICPSVATTQAPDHAGSVDAEFTLLTIHGVLHILGHDHAEPDETAVMVARERHHLARYGLDHPGAQEREPQR